jgi:hypothetical protein
VYLTAPSDRSPTAGPALTFTALIPDLHHYNGRGGRVFPLWHDNKGSIPNIRADILEYLSKAFQTAVSAEDLFAYIAAVVAQPAFTNRFKSDLVQPGLHVPLTADADLFFKTAEVGRTIIWLQTFGERFVDTKSGRRAGPPRLSPKSSPRIPADGAIAADSGAIPDTIQYDEGKCRLLIGSGYVENVSTEMWNYEVSGKHVLRQWFSYRKASRERPVIGDRRPPSKLGNIQPDHWLAEYTTELLNVLHVLGRLIELESSQAELLEQICSSPMISKDDLLSAIGTNGKKQRRRHTDKQSSLLDH